MTKLAIKNKVAK